MRSAVKNANRVGFTGVSAVKTETASDRARGAHPVLTERGDFSPNLGGNTDRYSP
jgi:hypothetical protein